MIGAGVIGLELGSVYARLGSEVTVLEFLDQITPGMDLEICKTLQKLLTRQGLKIVLGAAVQSAEPGKDGIRVTYKLRKDESEATLDADVVLVATGRRPYTEGLGLDTLGISAQPARPGRGRRPLADLASPASTPSATPSPAPCSRTRPRTRAWRSPRPSPASTAT